MTSFASLMERHRRRVAVAYLGVLALACAIVVVPQLRAAVGGRAARLFDLREAALLDRLRQAESLVEAGDNETALGILYDLDARFPARTNRHSLDRERERILHAIGAAELASGRKGRSLTAYRAAVAFDPNNVTNHVALAEAALALAEADEAATHFLHAFELYPSDAAAVRNLIAMRHEDADYAGVVEVFETYLGATRVTELALTDGDATVGAKVPVDGRTYEIRFAVSGLDRAVPLDVFSRHPTLEIRGARWESAARAGVPGRAGGDLSITRPEAAKRVRLPTDAAVAVLDVRVGVPIDDQTWSLVESSYRNLLRSAGAAEALSGMTVVDPDTWLSAEPDN